MQIKHLLTVMPLSLLLAGCTSPATSPSQTTDSQVQEAQKIGQIIASGGPAFCTVTNLSDNSTTEMTISGKKMKIVGNELLEGKKGTMINDSVYVYTWEDGHVTGFKTKLPTEEEIKETAPTDQPEVNINTYISGYDDESKYKLDCEEKKIAITEFTPPADVTFIDPFQMENLDPQELQKYNQLYLQQIEE